MIDMAAKLAKAATRKAKRAEKSLAIFGKPKRKKKYKPALKVAKEAYWETLREFVKWRDGEFCRICNANPGNVRYHIIPSNEGAAAKWDHNNVVWACASCNNLERRFRARYVEIHKTLFGEQEYAKLRENADKTVQYRADDFREMREALIAKMAGGFRS